MDERTAVEIATNFVKANDIDFEEFAHATYFPERQIWACCFLERTSPDYVDTPGMIIVDVDCSTGKPTFFETL
jgi:hypothetical protein